MGEADAAATETPWRWLETTAALQREAFGFDPEYASNEMFGEYWTYNAWALVDELSEAMDNLHWKPWDVMRGLVRNRDAAVGELVDAAHFLANIAVSLKVTDDEWEERYRAKQGRNAARAASGTYAGVGSEDGIGPRE